VKWVLVLLAACGTDTGAPPEATLPARVRLVTDAQYANAVHDLLGDVKLPAVHSPGTQPHQLIHDDNVLAVDAPLLVQYRLAAEEIAPQVAGQCPDVACAFAFATRAFRRPLDDTERTRLGALYDSGGFSLVAEAVLQAPSFVYRSELSAELTPYELAAELSFLFLDSIPDAPLWDAARAGTIDVDAQVERLLALPRVQAHLTDVVMSWLDLHAIASIYRVELTPALAKSMAEQVKLYVDDILWRRGGSLRTLLTARETFADAQLASYYGAPSTWWMQPVVADENRAGLLAQPGVLALLAQPYNESIILRGLYVQRKFLCAEDLGRPPFASIAQTADLTRGFNEAQLAHFRAQHVYCSSCHRTIDPAGFALHHFDLIGRWRETDTYGLPIEDDVRLAIDGTVKPLRGASELGRVLAESDQVSRCVVDQLAHHALGRALHDPATRAYVQTRFERADRDLVEVFRAIATAPIFRRRK
jgi:Protein of unknown function (DUF1592)/Protein of unknown function (DUF1588)/Protein of unknown function (DUF1595)/Protein of unknown function (DUF1585)/Protein of unknown function (DUF1587)